MNKAVFFDMDGTLYKTELILGDALNQTLNKLDTLNIRYVEQPMNKYKKIMGVPMTEVWNQLLVTRSEEDIKSANGLLQEHLITNINDGKGELYQGVEEVLSHIKEQRYNIYIISNGEKAYLDAICEHHNLEGLVDGVYSINLINTSDKSDLVKKVIEEESVKAHYMVGDRASDFKAGKDNNIEIIGCRFYFSNDEELKEADYTVDSFRTIKQIIN
ncbi:HAD hydrolase-like protein [Salinicoccus sesuvii]|uniref:HAD hydrolase-like protein n=1 Tax=Salinicoccus sesuvii TaxID=868281 RepID=A0ABV7N4R3_9STAP